MTLSWEDRYLSLSPLAFQAALNLAEAEGKPIGLVIEPFLAYAAPYTSPEEYLLYRVQPGDSLASLAGHFYGDGRESGLLKKANNLSPAGAIWEGLILVIPPLETQFAPDLSSPAQPGDDPGPLWSEAMAIPAEPARVEALVELLPRLPEFLVRETWGAVYELADVWEQSKLLAALAPRLAELGDARAAFRVVREIKRGWSQALALAKIAPYLPETLHAEAVAIARTIAKPENRVTAFAGLARHMPEPLRRELLGEALATLELIEGEPLLVEAWAELKACFREFGYQPETFLSPEEEPAPVQVPITLAEPLPEPAPRKRNRRYFSQARIAGKFNLLWLAPLVILGVCTMMLFTGSAVVGSVLLANQDQPLERVEVTSNGHSAISRVSLNRGEFYSIVVSGQFNYNVDQPESWADAQSSYYQRTGDWVSAYWISIDGQKVIAQQANPIKHLYVFYIQGNDRPVKFRIEERRETEYENNRGSLEVAIYTGLVSLEEIQE